MKNKIFEGGIVCVYVCVCVYIYIYIYIRILQEIKIYNKDIVEIFKICKLTGKNHSNQFGYDM